MAGDPPSPSRSPSVSPALSAAAAGPCGRPSGEAQRRSLRPLIIPAGPSRGCRRLPSAAPRGGRRSPRLHRLPSPGQTPRGAQQRRWSALGPGNPPPCCCCPEHGLPRQEGEADQGDSPLLSSLTKTHCLIICLSNYCYYFF